MGQGGGPRQRDASKQEGALVLREGSLCSGAGQA